MNPEPTDPIWEKISKAFFGGRRTEDEGLFVYRVMQEVRAIRPMQDIAWQRFLRWAIPVLGVGVASLVLATRTPVFYTEDPVGISISDTLEIAQ